MMEIGPAKRAPIDSSNLSDSAAAVTHSHQTWGDDAEHLKAQQHRVKLRAAMQAPTIACSLSQDI